MMIKHGEITHDFDIARFPSEEQTIFYFDIKLHFSLFMMISVSSQSNLSLSQVNTQ